VSNFNAGRYSVTLLSDGITWGDGAGPFGLVPRPKWSKLLPPDDQNRVPMALWCQLIEIDGLRILVDAGVGDKDLATFNTQYALTRPAGTLLDDLARHGLSTDDIDIVILTHLHGDHSGWIARRDEQGAIVRTFPRARLLVQRQEYEDATHPNERTRNTYFADNFVPLFEAGHLELLDGDTQIVPHVRVVRTPGHCMGHQSVIIDPPNARPTLILGDLAPFAVHFARLAWVTAYDVFPMTTIDNKRLWQGWALQNHPVLFFSHDTRQPMGQLVQTGAGFLSVEQAQP
jgi:glyoxylase-like metal-dependent hydrolase (beta-lactamase superfamily II)